MSKITIIPAKYKCRMCGDIFDYENTRICNVESSPSALTEVLHKIDSIPHQCMSDFINGKKVLEINGYPTEPNYLTFYGIADCIGVKVLAQIEED